jgi:hypothetical protein
MKRKIIVMKLNSVLLAGLISIGLLTIGLDGAFASGRGGRYFSAGNPGGIAATSGARLAHTPANQAWERNNAWANYTAQLRQAPGPNVSSGMSGPALQHNAPTP